MLGGAYLMLDPTNKAQELNTNKPMMRQTDHGLPKKYLKQTHSVPTRPRKLGKSSFEMRVKPLFHPNFPKRGHAHFETRIFALILKRDLPNKHFAVCFSGPYLYRRYVTSPHAYRNA